MIIKKLLAVPILCAGISLGCAAQVAGLQFAGGNASAERTEQDGTVKKTTGGEISVPFAGFLKEIIDAASKFIPGNGDAGNTVVNVNGSDVEVEE